MGDRTSISIPRRAGRTVRYYKYSRLQHPKEIRCLLLHPGQGDDKLVCTLRHQLLHEEDDDPSSTSPSLCWPFSHTKRLSAAPYEAVSYVWGTSVTDHVIICNDRHLPITKNLDEYLKQVRLVDRKRALWIDLICIDQDDNEEKCRQVRLMGQIYSRAERVLITLGTDELSYSHAQHAASLVLETNEMVLKTLARLQCGEDDWGAFPYPAKTDPLLSDSRWASVAVLVEEPWFNRGWVVQEAGLAKEAEILWGGCQISWLKLLRTCQWLWMRAPSTSSEFSISFLQIHLDIYGSRYPQESHTFYLESTWYNFQTLDILDFSRSLALTDPRDRIYAFTALPGAIADLQHIDINYEKDFLHIYQSFACEYITRTGKTDILQYIQHDESSIAEDFPSWVPQWQIDLFLGDALSWSDGVIQSSSPLPPTLPIILDNTILKTRGIRFDTIKTVTTPFSEDPSIDEVAAIWQFIKEKRADALIYDAFSILLAFYHTICMGENDTSLNPDMETANSGAYMLYLTGKDTLPDEPSLAPYEEQRRELDGEYELVHNFISTFLLSRRVVVTERGYLGLVPEIAREGDLCCLIFGTKAPFIIREAGDHFKIVGAAHFASNRPLAEGDPIPYSLGSGYASSEDWLEWGLDEEDLLFC